MSFTLFILLLIGLMAIGMPIALAMIASSVVYALMTGIDIGFFTIQMYASLNNFILLAIPFFLLASESWIGLPFPIGCSDLRNPQSVYSGRARTR